MQFSDEIILKDEMPNSVPTDVSVSVHMLAYKHEAFIRQAIEGVLMQKTNFSFELCIGEDDSPDSTRAICKEYAERYPDKIRLFLRRREDAILINGKPSGRRNGILTRAACRGRYTAICEGDDFWIDELKLQRQFDFMEANPDCSICATLGIERVVGGDAPDIIKPVCGATTLTHEWFLSGRTDVLTASLFWHKDLAQSELMKDLTIAIGDWALLVSITENGKKCVVLPYISVVYRKHAGGAWSGASVNSKYKKQTRLKAFEQYLTCAPVEDQPAIQIQMSTIGKEMVYADLAKNRLKRYVFLFRQLFSASGRSYLTNIYMKRLFGKWNR